MNSLIRKVIVGFLVITLFPVTTHSQTGRATQYTPGDWVNYSNFHYVTSFAEGDRYIYIGTTHGVLRYNQNTRDWEYPYTIGSGLQNDYVLNLLYNDMQQELWVVTRGGLDIISLVTDRWKHLNQTRTFLQSSIRQVQMHENSESVFVSNDNGETIKIHKFTHFISRDVGARPMKKNAQSVQSSPGKVGHYFLKGAWLINQNNNTLQDEYFREYPFTTILRDSRDQIWLGTWGAGFIKADAVTESGEVIRFGPVSSSVGAIFHTEQQFWFGSALAHYSGPPSINGVPGVSHWNMETNRWEHFRQQDEYGISNATIYNIDGDNQGVWFATERGMLHYDSRRKSWKNIKSSALSSHQVFDVLVQDTTVWVAARSGLYMVSNPGGRVLREEVVLPNRMIGVYALARDGDTIYAGTDYGLMALNLSTMEPTYYSDQGDTTAQEHFRGLRIYSLATRNGKVYFANDFGLFEQDPAKQTIRELPKVGLYARSVPRKIAVDDRSIWVGFDDGLGQYNPENREWEFFTTEDGLASNLVYDIIPGTHSIWIATQMGVTRFRPSKIHLR